MQQRLSEREFCAQKSGLFADCFLSFLFSFGGLKRRLVVFKSSKGCITSISEPGLSPAATEDRSKTTGK